MITALSTLQTSSFLIHEESAIFIHQRLLSHKTGCTALSLGQSALVLLAAFHQLHQSGKFKPKEGLAESALDLLVSHLLFPIFSLSIDDIRASNTPLPLTPSLSSSASRNPTSPSSSIFTADSIHPISPSIHSSLSLVFLYPSFLEMFSIPARPLPRLCSFCPSPTSSQSPLTPTRSSLPLPSHSASSFSETPKSSIDSSLHPLDTTSSGNVSPSPPSFRPKPDRPPRSPQLFANSPLSFLRLTPLKHCVVEPAHKHQQRSQAPSAPFQRVSRRSDLSADVADISPKTTTPQPALSTPPLACPPSFLAVPPAVAACALSTMSLSPDRDQQFSNNLSDPPKTQESKKTGRTTKKQS
ncbi:hypothetical protein BLNAU_9310 [Blattamonas nauphoetae]|uniref:Uncharacterized protein n=1 Tax=Blattamonas nauphoetae TaxID=2049346 RepID=A0ABQ9XWC0_9EUKA|nr:hypothetical protein BLNAU_9310 [Blattamonas nauphoetae]